jgi:hypothetical protein
MKTDELINMLGTNLEPVKGGTLRNTVIIALVAGAVATFCLVLAMFGLPAAALGGENSGLKILALAFTLGLVSAGASFLIRSARPGEPGRQPLILIGLLFFAILSAGLVALILAHPTAWGGMVLTAMGCLPGVYSSIRRRTVRIARLGLAQGGPD